MHLFLTLCSLHGIDSQETSFMFFSWVQYWFLRIIHLILGFFFCQLKIARLCSLRRLIWKVNGPIPWSPVQIANLILNFCLFDFLAKLFNHSLCLRFLLFLLTVFQFFIIVIIFICSRRLLFLLLSLLFSFLSLFLFLILKLLCIQYNRLICFK